MRQKLLAENFRACYGWKFSSCRFQRWERNIFSLFETSSHPQSERINTNYQSVIQSREVLSPQPNSNNSRGSREHLFVLTRPWKRGTSASDMW
ncbi:hypothetical protein CEXT_227771 [Caerostris extrusa]|uniref:Ycf15 n=1 Tax=Caerostris extrusa TaxID=172846 RepID=A0AAV4NKH2_CAEEX|nr:hypothetical protein CEXT_227771 [Caerostris extrusa]